MQLPEDTHLAYIVMHQSWWWRNRGQLPCIMVQASAKGKGTGGGVAWEFEIVGQDLSGPVTRVKVFSDAYAAFAQVPELFAALASDPPATLEMVVGLLERLGATDETERTGGR